MKDEEMVAVAKQQVLSDRVWPLFDADWESVPANVYLKLDKSVKYTIGCDPKELFAGHPSFGSEFGWISIPH